MSKDPTQNQQKIPILMTDAVILDEAFTSTKDRFAAQMQKIDDEMNKISKSLALRDLSLTSETSSTISKEPFNLDFLVNSSLVDGEGENRILKLQYDVSHFDPSEVTVSIVNNKLIVSAAHQEISDNSTTLREFRREFNFPQEVDPETIVSSLSKDGVLIVQAPLPDAPRESLIK